MEDHYITQSTELTSLSERTSLKSSDDQKGELNKK